MTIRPSTDGTNSYRAAIIEELRLFVRDLHGAIDFKFWPENMKLVEETADRIAQQFGPNCQFRAVGFVGNCGDAVWEPGREPKPDWLLYVADRSDATRESK